MFYPALGLVPSSGGGGGATVELKSASFTAEVNKTYSLTGSAAAQTITLPAGAEGDTVKIINGTDETWTVGSIGLGNGTIKPASITTIVRTAIFGANWCRINELGFGDEFWTGNADAGDVAAAIPTQSDISTAAAALESATSVTNIGTIITSVASKVKAIETSLRNGLYPHA